MGSALPEVLPTAQEQRIMSGAFTVALISTWLATVLGYVLWRRRRRVVERERERAAAALSGGYPYPLAGETQPEYELRTGLKIPVRRRSQGK
jgi:hypothetical protein